MKWKKYEEVEAEEVMETFASADEPLAFGTPPGSDETHHLMAVEPVEDSQGTQRDSSTTAEL